MEDGKNTVLFVDDEKNVLSALRRGLIRESYQQFFAQSGQEALEIMAVEDIDVIVSDMRMPEMDGLELLKEVSKRYPETVKVILSGYTQLPQILATINQVNIFKFITKPWDMESEFKGVIMDAIAYYNTLKENQVLKVSLEKKNALYSKLLKENDEKLFLLKSDFANVEQIHSAYIATLFDVLKDKGQAAVAEDIQFFETGRNLIRQYMAYLPTVNKDFTTIKLINDIIQYLAYIDGQREENYHEVFKRNASDKAYYHGHYHLLFLVLKIVLEFYAPKGKRDLSRITISRMEISSSEGNIEEKEELQFLMALPKVEEDLKSKGYEVIQLILTHFVGILNGNLQFTQTDGKHVFVLKVVLDVVRRNG